MSGIVSRRLASTPVRSAGRTWRIVVDLLAPDPDSDARAELERAAGVACAAISSEATAKSPIVVWGHGPRVRLYCLFDDDALSGEGLDEEPLHTCPTDGDWAMSIPCLPEDLDWSDRKLAEECDRVRAHAAGEDVNDGRDSGSTDSLKLDLDEFMKP